MIGTGDFVALQFPFACFQRERLDLNIRKFESSPLSCGQNVDTNNGGACRPDPPFGRDGVVEDAIDSEATVGVAFRSLRVRKDCVEPDQSDQLRSSGVHSFGTSEPLIGSSLIKSKSRLHWWKCDRNHPPKPHNDASTKIHFLRETLSRTKSLAFSWVTMDANPSWLRRQVDRFLGIKFLAHTVSVKLPPEK